MNLTQFKKLYGTNEQCLRYVLKLKYKDCPKCRGKLYPIKGRKNYACRKGHQVVPLSGTIFHKSKIELSSWFFAIYLMSQTRNGISAKFLERMLGVTYKTAWRMFNRIRTLMNEDFTMKGTVEIDETYIGGKDWFSGKKWWSNNGSIAKVGVLGMIERKGRVRTMFIPDAELVTLTNAVYKNVSRSANVMTDGHTGYRYLPKIGYNHKCVNHSVQYVDSNDKNVHTNNIESFWGQMKRGLTGTYRTVSPKYLLNYCDEFSFRHNHRKNILESLLERIAYEVLPF
jgi:hypothetical protein